MRWCFVLGGLFFISGCDVVESLRAKVEQVKQVQYTVQELQQNIQDTKTELDTKIKEIQAAQDALSKVFGTQDSEQTEIQQLRQQALELQKKLNLLEGKSQNSLEDMSEFSIE